MAWRDPALERTCSSAEAIELRWPQSAVAMKRLLWIVKHSKNLAALVRHPSIRIAAPAEGLGSPLSIRLRKAGIHAMALARTGEVIDIAGPEHLVHHASSTTALLIADIMAEESGSPREAIR